MLLSLALSLALQDDPTPAEAVLSFESLDGTATALTAAELPKSGLGDAVFARYVGRPAELQTAGDADRAEVALHSGDRVLGQVDGGDEEWLIVEPSASAHLPLSIEEVASVLFEGRLPSDGSVSPVAPDEGDRLYVVRGEGVDLIDGVLIGFSDEGVQFEGRLGERLHAWDEVAALYVEDLGEGGDASPTGFTVELSGGGRLSGVGVEFREDEVHLARDAGKLILPAALVREVSKRSDGYRFLSEIEVSDGGPTSLFGDSSGTGMVYPHRIDRNCLNGPLRSGARVWSRGLGVHAPSRLTFPLNGEWKRLLANVAIDDSSLTNRHPGSVIFRIHVDGELAWESDLVRGGDPAQKVDVSLKGAKELVLEVDTATEAFVSDRANWLRPILVR